MSRTDAILQAVQVELQRRRTLIDESPALSSVALTIKLQDGPIFVRAVIYEDQQLVARRAATT